MVGVYRRLTVLAVAGLTAVATALGPGAVAQAATVGLDGTVTSADTGAALVGAGIVAQRPDGSNWRFANTDSAGQYSIPDLPAGTYVLRVSAGGYLDQEIDDVAVPGTRNVVLEPLRYGTLGGHLRTPSGAPGPIVGVSLHDRSGNQRDFTATDAAGAYQFNHVLTGTYRVAFHYESGLTIWAHGKQSEFEADSFEVTADATTTVDEVAIEFGSIAVTVTDSATGQPVAGANLYPQDGPASFPSVLTDSTGHATITGALPGTYSFGVGGPAGYLNTTVSGVVVVANGTTAVAATLERSVTMRFSFVDARTRQSVSACVAYLVRGKGTSPTAFFNCAGSDGQLSLEGFPSDAYGFFVAPLDGVHGAQWVGDHGGTGDLDEVHWFRPAAGSTLPITVKLDKAGTITGVIQTPANGASVEGLCPSPVPSGLSYGSGIVAGLGVQCADRAGQYTIRNLGPYRWKIQFPDFSGNYAWQWSGNAPNRATATPVTVRIGHTTTANVTLRPAGTVSGTVTRPNGPVRFVGVIAVDARTGDYAAPYTSPNAAGAYQLKGFNNGFVRITFYPDVDHGFPYPRPVAVRAGAAVRDINMTLST